MKKKKIRKGTMTTILLHVFPNLQLAAYIMETKQELRQEHKIMKERKKTKQKTLIVKNIMFCI